MQKNVPTVMTPEMWELYRLVEQYTKDGKELRTEKISELIPYYKGKSPRCSKIYEDVLAINCLYNWQHDKYIITNHNRFKLATKEEILKEYKKIYRKYIKLNQIKKSLEAIIDTDGQYKLLSRDNKDINDTKGNKYIESFYRDGNN